MSMFQKSVINSIKQDESLVALRWAKFQEFLAKVDYIKTVKEEKYQDGFLKDVFENCLGYTLDMTNPSNYNLEREKKNETDGKKADGVIYIDNKVIGVIELKAQDTKNLDKIETQAFNYHASHSNSKYIIISNFDELRFYIDKKTAYEKFSLFTLSYEEFKKLHLLISFESIKEDIPLKLKEKTATFEQNISKELYKDFSAFRTHLFENIVKNNENIDKSTLLRLTQKLCDRIIFILFAEDRGLLTPNTIKEIITRHSQDVFGNSMYEYYKIYFNAINEGNEKLNIPKYNGGLFAKDELLDNLKIDDENLNMEAQKLSSYNFESEISVNILGHIFEQSLTDLEELQANIENINFDKTKSKRKKDGVFYTPEYITKYIVENTLGIMCLDKREELNLSNITAPVNPKKLTKVEQQTKTNLEIYKDWLFNLKILDPACGSGAFLNQALEYLIKEHKQLQNDLALMGDLFSSYTVEESVLEHNLYGVDINEDAVEIARLSLWLRTAQRGRPLTRLADKIICANSLLEMPFEENSFDIVIGNPPYVRADSLGNSLEFRETLTNSKYFETLSGKWDLYIPFVELSLKLVNSKGFVSLIIPDAYCHAEYSKKSLDWVTKNKFLYQIDYYPNIQIFENVGVNSIIINLSKNIFNNFNQRIHDTSELFSDNYSENYPTNFRLDSKETLINENKNYYKLNQICYITKGIVGNSDEKKFKGEFIVSDLLSSKKDTIHTKLYFEGKDIEKWILSNKRYIEFGTERSPNKWSRKGFVEMFEGTLKLVTMRSPGTNPRTFLDTENGYFNESAIGFKRWIDLKNIQNKSISGAYENENERYEFEKNSLNYSYFLILAILNSSLIKYELNSNRRSNIHIYPEDWKNLSIPIIEENDAELIIELENNSKTMLELNKKLQETKQNFYDELKLEKLTTKLQKFEELDFDDFIKEYTKSKKIKFADKLEERNFKNDWKALFENDKKDVLEIQNQINITDKEIDQMVYKLYDLSDDEIKIVEGV
ncbi:Eco57I restriction-modification methylase domain-containing protein [Aliarcobacter butzleri]|uniref:Eco57I restriction-modification methylase domain-containing protein n=1 Tax=Aliarcobacter butzleri TaxID=28197 RepID=UPI00263D2985|nr:Eco57I restriction-modification methylase domain-containing protein [Aliarcobacter butzleri]MDN5081366.1 Eco57I restriction-modification methylase domain-containing protein [Aliarcobacter butzleri]MDN5083526.1 Eco57I restriction-modification methylase domain-containing protein [Aliarcobacter butzleri]